MSMLQVLALSALSASAILAQDIAGTWQGKLQNGANELRTVFKITRTAESSLTAAVYSAVAYSLDEGATPITASSVVVQGSAVKILLPATSGEYQGKLSADGNTITGSWNTRGQSFPLTLARATEETAWSIPAPSASRLKPMRKDASPSFEVATIKPSDPNRFNSGFKINGHRVYTERENLRSMIVVAYEIHPRQIFNAPPWADSDFYDVNGVPDEPGVPSWEQQRLMYRKLLSDRFQLFCHRDKKELPVYIMVVGKNGPKLAQSQHRLNGMLDQTMNGRGVLRETNATMADFAGMLQSSILDRPVLDQTKLEGHFDFTLMWTPDQFQFSGRAGAEDPDAPPGLFTAIQEQLGLKLEATNAPADVLIIDKVKRPSEN